MLLIDVAEGQREYVWHGFILDSDLTFWVGQEKAGKGMLWGTVCANITRGLPMPPRDPTDPTIDWDQVPLPSYVIGISLEDDTATDLKPRARAAGADLELFDDMSRVERTDDYGGLTEGRFVINTDLGILGDRIDELNREAMKRTREGKPTGGVRLIVIDPIMAGAGSTVSFNQQVRKNIIEPLQEFARNKGVAVLLIGHFTKGAEKAIAAGKPFKDYIGGSKGIVDACRLTCVLLKDPRTGGKVRRLSVIAANGGATDEVVSFIVVANGISDPDAHLRFEMPRPRKMTSADHDAQAAYILRQLIELRQPADDRELATYLGLSHAIVQQATRRLQKEGRLAMGAEIRGKWSPVAAIEGPSAARVSGLPGPGPRSDWEPAELREEPSPAVFRSARPVPKAPEHRPAATSGRPRSRR